MIAFKSQKRQRDQQRKQKITENRKHLANVRVVQKNLVFVVGLPPRLADADVSMTNPIYNTQLDSPKSILMEFNICRS